MKKMEMAARDATNRSQGKTSTEGPVNDGYTLGKK
jgi:hypothetical protein